MILKFAFRNLVRLPWRTILYFGVVFFIVLSVSASLFVYGACANAMEALDESYIFIASLVPKKEDGLVLADVGYCLDGAEVLAYNVSIERENSYIMGGDYVSKLPEKVAQEDASMGFLRLAACPLYSTENLYFEYPFFTGECTIIEGTGITHEGYMGEKAELVIPWWLAEEYELSIGDELTRCNLNNQSSRYLLGEIVGIYGTSAIAPDKEDYPVYMPLAVAEMDYQEVIIDPRITTETIVLRRADFAISSRDDFEGFVRNAEKNGLNFQNVNIIFNNQTYDALASELSNINMIALIVMWTVLSVGLGMLVFFTVYLCNSRKQEIVLLSALGMTKAKIGMMIALELVVIILAASLFGFGAGRLAAEGVCGYVEGSVLAEASISEMIEADASSRTLEQTEPLERKMKMEISVSEAKVTVPSVEINYIRTVGENEIGISRHSLYHVGSNFETGISVDAVYVPTTLVGMTDISQVETSLSWEELEAMTDYYHDNLIYVFVSEDFDWTGINQSAKFMTTYLRRFEWSDCVVVSTSAMTYALSTEMSFVVIAGTYKENPYCSGNDILMRMEDYNKIYAEFSLTDDVFCFERVGEIVSVE